MLKGIDHVLIAVEDLELGIEIYERLGFEVLRGGDHPTMGTSNALIPLADGTYLELLTVRDLALAEREVPFIVAALRRPNRLARFALESDDIEADVAAIRARGLEMSAIRDGERTRPDGERVAWRAAFPTNAQMPFILQDVTPRALRVPAPSFGIGKETRMGDVNVGVTDLERAYELYKQLLGEEGEDGWFELVRGAVILKDVDTEQLLHLVLEGDNPKEVINAWQGGEVNFDHQVIGDIGITLIPLETAGVPLSLTGRIA